MVHQDGERGGFQHLDIGVAACEHVQPSGLGEDVLGLARTRRQAREHLVGPDDLGVHVLAAGSGPFQGCGSGETTASFQALSLVCRSAPTNWRLVLTAAAAVRWQRRLTIHGGIGGTASSAPCRWYSSNARSGRAHPMSCSADTPELLGNLPPGSPLVGRSPGCRIASHRRIRPGARAVRFRIATPSVDLLLLAATRTSHYFVLGSELWDQGVRCSRSEGPLGARLCRAATTKPSGDRDDLRGHRGRCQRFDWLPTPGRQGW